MNVFRLRPTCCALALTLFAVGVVRAQNAAAPISDFYTPYYRGQTGTESAFWSNSFTVAHGGPNFAPTNAPGGLASANVSITQQTNTAQIVSGGIYTGQGICSFTLNYLVSSANALTNGVSTVFFQTETTGYQLNYGSVVLTYTNTSGAQTLSPISSGQFYYTGTPGVGGASSADVIARWQWSLPLGDGVTNFFITFNGAAAHVDLGRAMLDVSATPDAGPFALQSVPPSLSRWMYPFDTTPTNDPTAPVFAAFGYTGAFGEIDDGEHYYFDTRDGQFLNGWSTSNAIPIGQGARNYLVKRVRVTLTLDQDMQYAYDSILGDYRTYFPSNDPRYVPTTDVNSPVELYGVGFRSGFTNSDGAYVPWAATNYPQDGPFFATPSDSDYTNRVPYAACFDTNGVLVDVSNNVGDDGTNEEPNPFEVAPFALGCNTNYAQGQPMSVGSQLTFDLNLNDPLIYSYVQQGLNQGNLSFMVTSLLQGSYGGQPNWPEFYTLFSALADSNQVPLLDVEGTVVRTNLDSDADGLPDDWEQFYFGHLGAGATNSFTGDEVSNLAKYVAGTNPTNAANDFRLLSIQNQSGQTELHFNFEPDRQYSILWSTDLNNWQTVSNPALSFTSAWLSKTETNLVYPSPVYAVWQDTNLVGQQRFYRVGVR